MNNKHFLRNTLSSALACSLILHSAFTQADDTEIFFSSPDTSTGLAKPNVLFILDNSGSMNWDLSYDDNPSSGRPSRIMVLKDAFSDILRNASGINAGIMVLNSRTDYGSSRYMYPVTNIDEEVPSGNTLAANTPGIMQSSDDATQSISPLGSAVINTPTLVMGAITASSNVANNTTSALGTNGIYFVRSFNSSDHACRMNSSGVTRNWNTACYNQPTYSTFDLPDADVLFSFQSMNIPAGATITSASISMTAANDRGNNLNPNISVRLEANKAHTALNDNNPVGNRSYLSTQTITTSGGWTDGQRVSLNVTNLMQQLQSVSPAADPISKALFRLSLSSNRTYRICTTGACMPQLIVNYTTSSSVNETRMTALRFQDVGVPSGATITSASISFIPAATAVAGDAVFEVKAENTSHATEFVAGSNLETRPKTAAVNWTSRDGTWIAGPTPAPVVGPDVTSLVQGLVNGSGWCGNNAMAFYIQPAAGNTSTRLAYSFDGSGGLQPVLNISYTGGSGGCINPILELRVNTDKNDGRQSGRSVYLAESTLSLNTSTLGARFESIPVLNGATVQDAKLILTAANTRASDTQTVSIGLESTGNSSPFTTSNYNLSNRIPSSTFSCTLGAGGSWIAGKQTICSSNALASSLQSIFANSDWESGNALSVLLSSNSSSSMEVAAYESNPSLSMKLRIRLNSGGLANQGKVTARDAMIGLVNSMYAQDGTPIVPTMYDAARYLRNQVSSRPTPITSSCQPTHLVLLTDGQANNNTDSAKNGIGSMIGSACTGDAINDGEKCARSLANFMSTEDQLNSLEGDSKITTHTVGFALNASSQGASIRDFLEDVSTSGGGSFNTADNASELSQAFNAILQEVLATDTTFVSASAPVNTFNRQDNKDELYFSLFRPAATDRWTGNLKRYRMATSSGNAYIVDADGVPAIDPLTGYFRANARSWWSSSNDGSIVAEGGAASNIPSPDSRNLLTNVTAASNALTEILESNTNLTSAKLGASSDTERALLIDYIRGLSNGAARKSIGDPIHATPSLVTYGCNATDSQGVCTSDVQSAIFGTNEGFVQMFDTTTGVEQFAFMPEDLLPNIKRLQANEPTVNAGGTRQYGMDNTVTVWANDANSNGVIRSGGSVESGEFVYAYATMGRGGRNLYALDISNPTSPRLMWTIKGGTTSGFARLGQTWSAPVRTKMKIGATDTDVLVFGGGYDPDQDDADVRTVDDQGNDLYVVNARTGALIWSASGAGINGMNYSIPSGVSVIGLQADSNGNTFTDPEGRAGQIFVGDMGGQVWRFHVHNGSSGTSLITGGIFASIAGSDQASARRFYHEPEIAVTTANNSLSLTVNIGSGYRGHPLDTQIDDRFYSFRTENLSSTGGVLTESTMYDATSLTTATEEQREDVLAADGWYIRLTHDGEKVLSRPLAVNGQLLFNTYEPKSADDACKAAFGVTRAYRVNLLDSTAIDDNRSVVIAGSSLPSNPQLYCKGNSCWAYNDPSQLIPNTGDSGGEDDECAASANPEKCRCDRDPYCEWMPSTPRTYWTDEKPE